MMLASGAIARAHWMSSDSSHSQSLAGTVRRAGGVRGRQRRATGLVELLEIGTAARIAEGWQAIVVGEGSQVVIGIG